MASAVPLYHDAPTSVEYGGSICTPEETAQLENKKTLHFAQLTVPLEAGIIKSIKGAKEAENHPCVTHYLQYYREGDEISSRVLGTLGQHFARISFTADSENT